MDKINTGLFQMTINGYKAFFPAELPFKDFTINEALLNTLNKAERAIGELKGVETVLPNANLLIQKYALKEALLSSQIEGTRTSIIAVIENKKDEAMDVKEVKNCIEALAYGINRIKKDDFPLCIRLIKEVHNALMDGVRGGEPNKTPGEFRKSQNWIGGVSPATAVFCPPPPEALIDAISNLEKYLHEENGLPDLIKCALIHYQFEAIHPFCDGNGRTGRMLIILYMISKGILNSPILYLSLFFKLNREDYYRHLLAVSKQGKVYEWVEFFLQGIIAVSNQVIATTRSIVQLKEEDKIKLGSSGEKVIDFLMQNPVFDIKELATHLNSSYNTAKAQVDKMIELKVVEQTSEGSRNKKFIYRKYMNILEEGCENF